MDIIRGLKEIPNLAIALGVFDGVHVGHQQVISCAVDFAKETGCKSAVVTFKEHPVCVLKGATPQYILTLEDKYKYIKALGVDYLIELDFAKIYKMTPEEYLEKVIVKYFSPKFISTGFNHRFGVDKSGNVLFLSDNQDKFGYVYSATPPQAIFGDMISSTAIREFVRTGVVDMAFSMLGRKFSVAGTVYKGKQFGRTIGYPTANIIYPLEIVQPPYGVYDVDVKLDDGTLHKGLANFGVCPTISNEGIATLEVHILDFEGDLYDREVKVYFNKMVREEIKFDSIDELKMQIALDIKSITH